MKFIKSQISKVVDFFVRRRWLYKIVGWGSFLVMFPELMSVDINKYFHLDFIELEAKYGQEITAGIAYLVDKFASEPDYLTVAISFFLIFICLFIDYRVSLKESSKNTIWNIFFSFNQNIVQNYNDDENK